MSLTKKIHFHLALGVLIFIFQTQIVFTQNDPYFGLDETASQAQLSQTAPSDVPTALGNVTGTVLSIIGVIFFILIVYGGFLWMTAHGDSGQVDKGKETIIGAVIGLIVVSAAYALTTFVFNATAGG